VVAWANGDFGIPSIRHPNLRNAGAQVVDEGGSRRSESDQQDGRSPIFRRSARTSVKQDRARPATPPEYFAGESGFEDLAMGSVSPQAVDHPGDQDLERAEE